MLPLWMSFTLMEFLSTPNLVHITVDHNEWYHNEWYQSKWIVYLIFRLDNAYAKKMQKRCSGILCFQPISINNLNAIFWSCQIELEIRELRHHHLHQSLVKFEMILYLCRKSDFSFHPLRSGDVTICGPHWLLPQRRRADAWLLHQQRQSHQSGCHLGGWAKSRHTNIF